jgi:hypothetical protein
MKTQDPFTTRAPTNNTAERRDGNRTRHRQAIDERRKLRYVAVVVIQSPKGFEDETRTRRTPNSYS